MPAPSFPIPRLPFNSQRGTSSENLSKIKNGKFQPPLPPRPPSLISFPLSVVSSSTSPCPAPNQPFNFPQKNAEYFPTYSCKEEIYVSSASVIELDCNSPTHNDGSDSGIYNASTATGKGILLCILNEAEKPSSGCSSCSENSVKREKVWGNAFCKSSYQLEGFYKNYEEQDVSVWIDLGVEGMHIIHRA